MTGRVDGPPRLRVSLDVSAVPTDPAGAGRYTLELARALSARRDVELVPVSRRGDADRWSVMVDRARVPAASGGPGVLARAPRARPARLVWEQVALPGVLRRSGSDVHHGPHYTMPPRAGRPVVVTVHDCTFFDHPEWHERSKVLVFRRAIRVAARRAAAIVCVSRTTAERLGELCRVAAPVVVAPHGVDHQRFSPEEPQPGADEAALRSLQLEAGSPFVLFVGTMEPRKNVPALVRAFDRIAAEHQEVRLVLAGQSGWGAHEVERAVSAARFPGRVVRTGYVPDGVVPALLRQATVVAYPSLEEGYGLPALEALACGAPLITTAGTAMAEMAGAAAVLVEPGSTEALGDALEAALSGDGDEKAERRRVGLAIAAGRTWEASAALHVEAYRRALS